MTARRFLIPSLLAVGFHNHDPLQAALIDAATTRDPGLGTGSLLQLFHQDHLVTLAQHRSHSSHSSHSSHRSSYGGGHYSHSSHTSHRSSTGGYDGPSYTPLYSPAATPTPTPAPPPRRSPSSTPSQPLVSPDGRATPPPAAPQTLSGRSKRFAAVVRRVQLALRAHDLYRGAIDGIVGPQLRHALRQFQTARHLEVTGTITPATLDALMVSSD